MPTRGAVVRNADARMLAPRTEVEDDGQGARALASNQAILFSEGWSGAPPNEIFLGYPWRTSRNWPPPGVISVEKTSSGHSRESRSTSQSPASSPSVRVGQRAMISRPPFRCRRSTLAMIGAGSTTKRRSGHATTAATAPFLVLHPRCASRSLPSAGGTPLPLVLLVRLSTLGPLASLTDISGSTTSSHTQQRQLAAAPISASRLTAPARGRPAHGS